MNGSNLSVLSPTTAVMTADWTACRSPNNVSVKWMTLCVEMNWRECTQTVGVCVSLSLIFFFFFKLWCVSQSGTESKYWCTFVTVHPSPGAAAGLWQQPLQISHSSVTNSWPGNSRAAWDPQTDSLRHRKTANFSKHTSFSKSRAVSEMAALHLLWFWQLNIFLNFERN